jgi:hypothetical protein
MSSTNNAGTGANSIMQDNLTDALRLRWEPEDNDDWVDNDPDEDDDEVDFTGESE